MKLSSLCPQGTFTVAHSGKSSRLPNIFTRSLGVALCGLLLNSVSSLAQAPATPRVEAAQSRVAENYAQVPLHFESNQGQTDSRVQFLSRGMGYTLFLSPGEAVLNLERQSATKTAQHQLPTAEYLRMKLEGADAKAAASSLDRDTAVVNYFTGSDPSRWHSNISTYGKVRYTAVYPGIDLVFYGNQRQLEYDFVVAPGADPSHIAWSISGAKAKIDHDGNLILQAEHGPVAFKKPVVYQLVDGNKTAIQSDYVVAGNQVRFKLGAYDHTKELVVDPVLSYASYLGGSATDQIGGSFSHVAETISQGIAVDTAGGLYVTGTTDSADFPVQAPFQTNPPKLGGSVANSVFVTKFSPDGKSLMYSTYLGGTYFENGAAIAVDASGSAYVTGNTSSPDFPVTAGAFQTVCGANWTGGPGTYVHTTNCGEFNESIFVTKLNPTGTGLVYSTFIGGQGPASAAAIAVDASGQVYISGETHNECASYQPVFACYPTTAGAVIAGSQTGGSTPDNAVVSVLDPTGSNLLYSTLFGDLNGIDGLSGNGSTYASAITVDPAGNFYVVGNTQAGRLPTTSGVIQPTSGPLDSSGRVLLGIRGFLAKFNPASPAGSSLAYATYLGAPVSNYLIAASGVALDTGGNVYVGGYTESPYFPVTAGAYQTTCGQGNGNICNSAFITKLLPDASAIVWSTILGMLNGDSNANVGLVGPVLLDGAGNVYITGQSGYTFPQVNPVQQTTGGNAQAFISKLDPTGSNLLFSSLVGSGGNTNGQESPAGIALDPAGNMYVAGNTNSSGIFVTPGAAQTTYGGGAQDGFVFKIAPFAVSTTTLSLSATSVNYGTPVTLTAVVTGPTSSPVPTGIVTFSNGATILGTGTLDGTGTATLSSSTLSATTYSITASYSGDSYYYPGTTAPQTLVVNPIATSTALTISVPTAVFGTSVTLSANVTPVAGTVVPTGTVSFFNGTSLIAAVPVGVTGSAAYTSSSLVVGSYSVTASYSGDSINASSTSTAGSLTITPATTGVAAPVISPAAGFYSLPQMITITDTTPGTAIYYVINGGSPIKYAAPFALTGAETVQAVALILGSHTYTESPVVQTAYNTAPATPVLSPANGTFTSTQPVTITDASAGVAIYYAVNGGSPIQYTGPVNVSATETIQAVAVGHFGKYVESGIASGSFTILP